MRRYRSILVLTAATAMAGFAAPALAQPGPQARCAGLVGKAFASLPEAPTQVNAARMVAKGAPVRMREMFPGAAVVSDEPLPEVVDDLPAYCEIDAKITPKVTIVLRMPTEAWNGKILALGCGGYCGTTKNIDWLDAQDGLRRGYAVTVSDMGHKTIPVGGYNSEAAWAYNNLPAEIDFGYRATHVNVVATKAIVAAFYGRPHRYTYFQGCSTGGRQGMMEAQRYPNDFNGIVSGAGPLYYATSGFSLLWSALANLDAVSRPILTRVQVELLHRAVIKACDGRDGLKDGILADPRACRFDPAKLQCRAGPAADCLTAAQVAVARKIYDGPVTSKGQHIHMGAPMRGSEMGWLNQFVADKTPAHWLVQSGDKFRYMSFYEDPGPSWTPKDIDWDAYADRARTMAPIYSATDPDLRAFKAAGGKLLNYQGWNDHMVTPETATDYYETVTRTMGGPQATRDFFRLFMLPGVGHCFGGVGASEVDYLSALEAWVEQGEAPEMLLGRHIKAGAAAFTRPHFPYPAVAAYAGRGDPNDARSFQPKPAID